MTFFLILIINIISICHQKKPFSFHVVFHLFSLIFFGYAGLFQFRLGVSYFGARLLNDNDFIVTNILIIFCLLIFNFIYKSFKPSVRERKIIGFYKAKKLNLFLIFTSLLSGFIVLYFYKFNLKELFFREQIAISDLNQSSRLILEKFIRPIPAICLLYYCFLINDRKFIFIILLLLCLLFFNPLGLPRYATASLYLPLLIVNFKFLNKGYNFILLTFLGLFFVFPLINLFRYAQQKTESVLFGIEQIVTVNFDTYQSLVLTLNGDLITYGKQLLGVIFFWVPRSLWINKPTGSGKLIADNNSYFFDNVSANFLAEGYLNFGLIGVFLFIIALALLSKWFDNIFFKIKNNSTKYKIIYLIFLSMLIFILRGDMMSSLAYLITTIYSVKFLDFSLFFFKVYSKK